MNRRQLMQGIGLASVTGALGVAAAEDAEESMDSTEPQSDDTVDYLFVQNAEAVTLAGGVLTLKDVNTATIFFSDRPDRIVGHTPTDEFVAQWGHGGDDSFAADNAQCSIVDSQWDRAPGHHCHDLRPAAARRRSALRCGGVGGERVGGWRGILTVHRCDRTANDADVCRGRAAPHAPTYRCENGAVRAAHRYHVWREMA